DLMKGTKQDSAYVSEWQIVSERAKQSLISDFADLGFQAIGEWAFGEAALASMPKVVRQRLADNAPALKLQMLSPVKSAPSGCAQIKRIDCPVLYVEGARSPWHAHAMADEFMKCRPATRRVLLKNVSHGMV